MANLESARARWLGQRRFCLFVDYAMQFAFRDRFEKTAHFRFIATHLKFHPSVDQVADPSFHLKSFGDVPHRPAEANALDRSFVENLERDHLFSRCSILDTRSSLSEPPPVN